ncbi:unnamed protein product [Bursaphelenchus xylophilus]|uniref:Polypeptide N-acetylgalactosaminyltransferase n=1 Tax=Bursaphelenchus xylophilus TaxID=6326 RepID=A0A1I7SDG7_BURXY|nr:unnamed protein product [Bursaphelenchus xylophilus]CAG9131687.1 unnamed protein product [Bursaphelenchus xylophilus]
MVKKEKKPNASKSANSASLSYPAIFLIVVGSIALGFYAKDLKELLVKSFSNSELYSPSNQPLSDAKENIIYRGPQRILTSKPEELNEIEQRLKLEIDEFNFDPVGPGAFNKPTILPENLKKKSEERYSENNFDVVVSDLVSINRALTDVRNHACQKRFTDQLSIANLPNTSLIIVFHNEAFSTLIRTLHSIIQRTPLQLIHEIILVDDQSDRDWLKEPLQRYLDEFPFKNIKLIRLPERSGLIKARLVASDAASGQVLLFLDAHIEVTKNWLQPLLTRVHEEPNVLVAPLIDVIDLDTFEYRTTIDGLVGGFNWRLTYNWGNLDEIEAKRRAGNHAEPFKTPVIAGGLFAVRREYFYQIGTYDEDMKVWGGENVEISMRVWRCGGQLEIHPCSRVGHVFRKVTPYTFPGGIEEMITHNELRTALVWLDEYLPFYTNTHPFSQKVSPGSVEKRLALREKLQCKSFRWYITNIYRTSPFPLDFHFLARIRSVQDDFLVDSRQQKQGKLFIAAFENFGNHQLWVFDKQGVLYNDHACIAIVGGNVEVIPFEHKLEGCARFEYEKQAQRFIEKSSGLCLGRNGALAILDQCDRPLTTEWKVEELATPSE